MLQCHAIALEAEIQGLPTMTNSKLIETPEMIVETLAGLRADREADDARELSPGAQRPITTEVRQDRHTIHEIRGCTRNLLTVHEHEEVHLLIRESTTRKTILQLTPRPLFEKLEEPEVVSDRANTTPDDLHQHRAETPRVQDKGTKPFSTWDALQIVQSSLPATPHAESEPRALKQETSDNKNTKRQALDKEIGKKNKFEPWASRTTPITSDMTA